MLKPGDLLVPSNPQYGYELLIPEFNDINIQSFYALARLHANESKGLDRIKKLVDFVHVSFDIGDYWNTNSFEYLDLSDVLNERKGACKELSAITDIILNFEGFETEYKRGILYLKDKQGRHAWLKTKYNNKYLLVDPSFNLCYHYNKAIDQAYYEGENKIEHIIFLK